MNRYQKSTEMESEDMQNIHNFEFKQTLGTGTFGKVKLSRFKPTSQLFAIKVLSKKTIIERNEMNLVERELSVIKQFDHPNVIKVFQIIEDSKNFYIIMEYCQHGELFDYIVNHKHLSEDESALFFYQIVNGVEHIHKYNVSHRDLKPENLLLNDEKEIKIIDFGLSSPCAKGALLTTKCGSPSYASPELIKEKYYDGFKTDIWCIGIILYAMICGYLPFDGEENKELFKEILEKQPEFPKWVTSTSRDIIEKILEKDPKKRITMNGIKKSNLYLRGKEMYVKKYGGIKFNRNGENGTAKSMRKLKITQLNTENNEFNVFKKKLTQINSNFNKKVDSLSSKINKIIVTDTVIQQRDKNKDDITPYSEHTNFSNPERIKNRPRILSTKYVRWSKEKESYKTQNVQNTNFLKNIKPLITINQIKHTKVSSGKIQNHLIQKAPLIFLPTDPKDFPDFLQVKFRQVKNEPQIKLSYYGNSKNGSNKNELTRKPKRKMLKLKINQDNNNVLPVLYN